NVQKNFVKKIKTLITEIVVKRNLQHFNIPGGLQEEERQKLKREKEVIKKNLKESAKVMIKILWCTFLLYCLNTLIQKGISYDITIRLEAYLNSYIQLSYLFEQYLLKPLNAIPLSTSTVPWYLILDSNILLKQILGITKQMEINEEQYLDIGLKKRGVSNELSFTGMIRTDLVGISVNVGPPPTKGRRGKKKIRLNVPSTEVYLERNAVGLIKENFVVIDPKKRDLLYCLGSNNQKLRYTQSKRETETRKKKRMSVTVPHTTCDPIAFNIYLKTFFSEEFFKKKDFYGKRIFRKLRFNAFINTKKSEEKFIKKSKGSYGDGRQTTVIIGDWDSGGKALIGQVTTKGKGFREMFRRGGFDVLLLDEYKTSKVCRGCSGETLENFKKRTNQGYGNRDDVATLNQRCIVDSFFGGDRPYPFLRSNNNIPG
ncbi:hypothetical protein HK099_007354, partial [Clydaea vesicula]